MRSLPFVLMLVIPVVVVLVYDRLRRDPAPAVVRQPAIERTPADPHPQPAHPSARTTDEAPGPRLRSTPSVATQSELAVLEAEVARLARRLDVLEDRIRQHEGAIGALKQTPVEDVPGPRGVLPRDVEAFRTLYEAMRSQDRERALDRRIRELIGRLAADDVRPAAVDAVAASVRELRRRAVAMAPPDWDALEQAVRQELTAVMDAGPAARAAHEVAALARPPDPEAASAASERMVGGMPIPSDR